MVRSILLMAAGVAGTMAGIIATGIMAAGVAGTMAGIIATGIMAAGASAKSLFENLLSLLVGEEFSIGLARSDWAYKKHTRADAASGARGDGHVPVPRRSRCLSMGNDTERRPRYGPTLRGE